MSKNNEEKVKKNKKEKKQHISKTAQQSIPYQEVYPNGMIMIEPGLFSKSYFLDNMNFETENEEKQESILEKYGKLLNKFGHNVIIQINIFNRKTSELKVEEKFFIKPKNDNLQEYREEYNDILSERIKEGRNDIQKERYITLALKTTDVIMANTTFITLET
ncbi:MAG: hypothetical protein ACK5LL_11475, partial [Suipraeoptans sp.]